MNESSSPTAANRPWLSTLCDVVRWALTGGALLAAVFVSMPAAHAAEPASPVHTAA